MAKLKYNKKYILKDGTTVPGVTTVIKGSLGWGQQALMGWVAKVTKEGKNFRDMSEEAGDAGTLAHALVEAHIKGVTVPNEVLDSYTDEQRSAAFNAKKAFDAWVEYSSLGIIQSEVEVLNHKRKYGGTIDLVMQDKDGGIHIADIKTTNFLLPDHLIQIAAYADAYQDQTGDEVVAGHLLRFNKGNDVTFHHTLWEDTALVHGLEAFVHLRSLHDLKKIIEGLC